MNAPNEDVEGGQAPLQQCLMPPESVQTFWLGEQHPHAMLSPKLSRRHTAGSWQQSPPQRC